MAEVARERGRLDEAYGLASKALAIAKETGMKGWEASAHISLARTSIEAGRVDDARRSLEEAERSYGERGIVHDRHYIDIVGVRLLVAEGKTDEAVALARRLVDDLSETQKGLLLKKAREVLELSLRASK